MAKKKTGSGQYPLRLPDDLRLRIEKAAKDRNISLNAAILERLERSFETEDRLGGPRVAEMIETIAAVMKSTGEHAGFFETGKLTKRGDWLVLPYAFDQATRAATTILEHYKPPGDIVHPKPNVAEVVGGDPKEAKKLVKWLFEHIGEGFALRMVRDREEKK